MAEQGTFEQAAFADTAEPSAAANQVSEPVAVTAAVNFAPSLVATIDRTYGVQGTAEAPAGAQIMDALADRGGIVVAGRTNPHPIDDYAAEPLLARIDADGKLDTNFGSAGVVVLPKPEGNWIPYTRWAHSRGSLRASPCGWSVAPRFKIDAEYNHVVPRYEVSADGQRTSLEVSSPQRILTGMTVDAMPIIMEHDMLLVRTGIEHVRKLPSILRVREDGTPDSSWTPFDFAEVSPTAPVSLWAWSASDDTMVVLAGANGAAAGVTESTRTHLFTFDARTGQRRAERAGLEVHPDELWISRPSADGEFLVAEGADRVIRVHADGSLGEALSVPPLAGATHGFVGRVGERDWFIQYGATQARLHGLGVDGSLVTPPAGIRLEGFALRRDAHGKQERLLEVLPDGDRRVLLVFGADSAEIGWRIVRYWL